MKIVPLLALFSAVFLHGTAVADAISETLNSSLTFSQSAVDTWTTGSEYCSYYYDDSDTYCEFRADIPYVRTQSFSYYAATNVTLSASAVSGPGKLTFLWKNSYYNGYFYFRVNGQSIANVSSSGCWYERAYVFKENGDRTFSWQYNKPASSYNSNYRGYLANVVWEPAPASVVVKFHPCGGTVENPEKSYNSGSTYGNFPLPLKSGYAFEGWYTLEHGGTKLSESDYVDWGVTNVYAHWTGGSLAHALSGIATTSSMNDATKWDFGNGMTTALPCYQSWNNCGEKIDNWILAQVDGESILSFDWQLSYMVTSRYSNVWIFLDFYVDGELVSPESRIYRYCPYELMALDFPFDYIGASGSGFSGDVSRTMKVYLTPGAHTVMWRVSQYSCSGAEAYATIRNVTKQAVDNPSSVFDVVNFVRDFKALRPNDMTYLRDTVYGQRIATNSNDYEARILRAATKLGALAYNAKAREIIAECGYVVSNYTFMTTGEFVGFENAPLSNDVVDEMLPEVLTAVDSALEDLKAIPVDWTGRIEFTPEDNGFSAIKTNDYYKEEKVYVGIAEVSLFRAAVEMFRAQLKLAQGYDYEADYLAVSNAYGNAEYISEVMAAAPNAGTVRDMSALIAAKEDFRAALESVKRADTAIVNRGDYDTYLFEYDLSDAEEIAECRKLLNQIEESLDATNVVDLSYFGAKYDTNGVVKAKIPGGEFAKQLFLGALFAGKVTRTLAPEGFINRDLNRVDVHMQTFEDPTVGGLVPWLTLNDIARYYPFTQEWEMSAYLAYQPEVALQKDRDFIVYCTAERDGKLSYSTEIPGVIYCCRDWSNVVDVALVESTNVQRTVLAETGHVYSVHFKSNEKMSAAEIPIAVSEVPIRLADGGPYTETVEGVEITFEIVNGEAWIGTSGYDPGVPENTTGEVDIPATLGGWPVVGIRPYAFFRCMTISALVFYGDKPAVGVNAFLKASIGAVYVTRFANWDNPLPATWQGFSISYIAALNSALVVAASQPSGSFSGSTTLSLSAPEGCTIRYSLDGSDPTKASPTYTSPIGISSTKTVKFFAVEDSTGDWGPISSVTLTRVASEAEDIVVTPSVADGAKFVGSQSVSLSAGAGQTIYYTTDGSDPRTSNTRQTYADPIYMSESTTLKYYAVDSAYGDWSPVQTVHYVLRKADGGPYQETVDGIVWSFWVEDGKAHLGTGISYSCEGSQYLTISQDTVGAVRVPSLLGECPVVGVGPCAFYGCLSLTSVALPDSIECLGGSAFYCCSSLREITLGSAVTNIGEYAFYRCSSLSEITLGSAVSDIGARAFSQCSKLARVFANGDSPLVESSAFTGVSSLCTVYVKKGTTGWGTVPGTWNWLPIVYLEDAVFIEPQNGLAWNYRDTGSLVVLQRDSSLAVRELAKGDLVLPASMNSKPVTTIGSGLLQGAVNVTSITVPDTVTDIESSAFRECTRLKTVALSEGLTSIGDSAFERCASLTDITIPSTVTNIGYFAFRDCLRLTNVTLLGEAPRQDLGVFMGVPAFTTISARIGSATAIVYTIITNDSPEIEVPTGWLDALAVAHDKPTGESSYQEAFVKKFGSDLNVALTKPTGKHDLHGNPLYVWQDYVAGTDPLDEEDTFTATLTIVDGLPVVKWSPELSAAETARRKYVTYGATALDGKWIDVSSLSSAERQTKGYQFFRVSVELKK